MKVAVVHNLVPGGAHRRLAEQVRHLDAELVEVCLSTAAPVTPHPMIVPYRAAAPVTPRPLRPPLRYLDLVALGRAWRRAADEVSRLRPDVVFANPCHLMRAPGALAVAASPSLYFCDEP